MPQNIVLSILLVNKKQTTATNPEKVFGVNKFNSNNWDAGSFINNISGRTIAINAAVGA